jgi:hypothetical protein
VVAPPVVSVQQSAHTIRRQRAHGPTATLPQMAHRVAGGSPAVIKPDTRAV